MSSNDEYYMGLIGELLKTGNENECLEFKHNKIDNDKLGQYISALSNSAALCEKEHAYIIFGVDDVTLEPIGTNFDWKNSKQGNQELESWLLNLLTPRINFSFHTLVKNDKTIVIVDIEAAKHTVVKFKSEEFIRVGSCLTKLKCYPEKERSLWRALDKVRFENEIAKSNLSGDEVISLLDYPKYFDLLKLPLPENKNGILDDLNRDALIVKNDNGNWDVTNLGAILFAKRLKDFNLERKAVRIIFYKGYDKFETIFEKEYSKGYVSCFEDIIEFINTNIPKNEILTKALRDEFVMFPDLAIRELVANALIHQDFFQSGTNPMIETFSDRMEIVNPGKPLVEVDRFLGTPPKSRNEKLASFMRRVRICEERGSGIQKVARLVEIFQLPAPIFSSNGLFTKATLFAHKEFDNMSKDDKIRSCYMHCVIKYLCNEKMDNSSLRERFKLEKSSRNTNAVARIIAWTKEKRLIVDDSDTESRRFKKYIPYWRS